MAAEGCTTSVVERMVSAQNGNTPANHQLVQTWRQHALAAQPKHLSLLTWAGAEAVGKAGAGWEEGCNKEREARERRVRACNACSVCPKCAGTTTNGARPTQLVQQHPPGWRRRRRRRAANRVGGERWAGVITECRHPREDPVSMRPVWRRRRRAPHQPCRESNHHSLPWRRRGRRRARRRGRRRAGRRRRAWRWRLQPWEQSGAR